MPIRYNIPTKIKTISNLTKKSPKDFGGFGPTRKKRKTPRPGFESSMDATELVCAYTFF